MWRILAILILCYMPLKAINGYSVYMPKKVIDKSHEILSGEIGKTEKTGRNDGEHVARYLASVGIYFKAPYCMAIQYWSIQEAIKSLKLSPSLNVLPRTGSTGLLLNYAKSHFEKCIYRVLPNSLLVWHNGKNGHIASIETVGFNGWVVTIEGNTSNGKNGSQFNGNGNFRRARNIKQKLSGMPVKSIINLRSM